MIAFFDPRGGYLAQRDEIDAAIRRVLLSGRWILGPEVEAFEREFAAFVGVNHAVGTASGTSALELAMRAVGVAPGDEVITIANAGVPTVAAIRALHAIPRFVDVEPRSLLLDPRKLADAITPRTRCIIPVHLYGRAADIEAILSMARAGGASVIEDCAHAHGTQFGGRHVGGFGDIGCFSFYPSKNLGAVGDAGCCVTNSRPLAHRLRVLGSYGAIAGGPAMEEGIGSRLDEIQAAVLRVKLRGLPQSLALRRSLAQRYDECLRGQIELQPLPASPEGEHSYHLYVARTPNRKRVGQRLDAAEIGWRIHYPTPVHVMPAYTHLGYTAGSLPVTEETCEQVISLPLYPGLSLEQVSHIAAAAIGE